jgi:hypothetical protein
MKPIDILKSVRDLLDTTTKTAAINAVDTDTALEISFFVRDQLGVLPEMLDVHCCETCKHGGGAATVDGCMVCRKYLIEVTNRDMCDDYEEGE